MSVTVMDATRDGPPPGTTVVRLGSEYGSTGVAAIAELERDLLGEIETTGASLLLNMHRTDYIGCGFLDVLIRCSVRAAQKNVHIVLCAINPQPADVLELTGLDSLWKVYRTDHEAMEALQQPPAAKDFDHVSTRCDANPRESPP